MLFELAETQGKHLVIWQHTANQPKSIGCDAIVNLPSSIFCSLQQSVMTIISAEEKLGCPVQQ